MVAQFSKDFSFLDKDKNIVGDMKEIKRVFPHKEAC